MTIDSTSELLIQLQRVGHHGTVSFPGDQSYDMGRAAWNLTANQLPAAVALPEDAEDVRRVVIAAVAAGLRVAPQSTGHNATPMEPLHDAVLLKTERLRDVVIDAERRTATVGAGVLWEDVVTAAGKEGLTALHGSSPNVGVAGYLLGGGLSWFARAQGLANNHIAGIDIVLADGRLVHADAENYVEVFWALRGGGGSFGVVTSIEIELIEVESVYAGMMLWDQVHADRVLRVWRDWAATAPDSVTTSFRLMNFPPLPEFPDFLRGRRVVILDGVAQGDETLSSELLAPLRDLQPEIDTFAITTTDALLRLHMDPEDPIPVVSDSIVLASLGDDAASDLLAVAGPGAPPALLIVELRQLGGALAHPHDGGGVLNHLPGEFLLWAGAVVPTPEAAAAGREEARAVVAAVSPHGVQPPYLNFVENPSDVRRAFDPLTWRQVVGIKSAFDPMNVFVANHPIPTLYMDGAPTT
ncbi:FAD-binding oxidoreductase [Aeromicrobium wangtongii]|uniref:FAD-binding oxidoreductase n=1 Tax=Aeromicrobium wangtongii TaxID=2969247 RepID=UPI002017E155|nr:FAD-binding oxidoreductase [Aeromicrobium wangtongii]MCL3819359.1 FAD-binding oxidoreductase [Aeromicrobium wangtongii]